MVFQRGGAGRRIGGRIPGDEFGGARRAGASGGHGGGNQRMLEQAMFDFGRLDAVTAHLQLAVFAAQKFHFGARGPAAQIARAVDALAGMERIFHKARRVQLRPVQIAAAHGHAAQADLARHASGHGAQFR